jgi:hypothetical protein
MIIMLTKLRLQLSILLDYDDNDDEYHPNRNAMKIANIVYVINTVKAMIMTIIMSNNSMIIIIIMLHELSQ